VNWIRLKIQWLLSAIAIPLGFNHRLSQFCDRCGKSHWMGFWAANDVWIAVAGNVNDHRHGAFCISCFDALARRKGILLDWTPTFEAKRAANSGGVTAKEGQGQ
jgi:hypothetical protein